MKNKNRVKFSLALAMVICMAVIFAGCNNKDKKENDTKQVNQTVEQETTAKKPEYTFESEQVEVSKYYVYGTRFNFEGQLTTDKDVSSVSLIAASYKEYPFDCVFSKNKKKENTFNIKVSKWINQGVYLDQFPSGEYKLHLKVMTSDGNEYHYQMANKTEYPESEYYTMTKNQTNKKVVIQNDFQMNITDEKEPDELYDIAIDPGHGGLDTGAAVGKYMESDIGLSVAEKVKALLEEKGYKVMLTRDGTEGTDYTAYNTFDKNGRVTLTCKAKAKYAISIHCNSSEVPLTKGGSEIYIAPACKETMAKNVIDSMCEEAGLEYSSMQVNKRCKGVYAQGHDDNAKAEIKRFAAAGGYKPFKVTTNTPYLYMIRETGGIVTGAFNDGRMPKYSANQYMKSNVATETYLLELGYLTYQKDFNIITKKQDAIAQGIADGIIKSLVEQEQESGSQEDNAE